MNYLEVRGARQYRVQFRVSTLNKFRIFAWLIVLKAAGGLHINLEIHISNGRTSYNRDKCSLEEYLDSLIVSSLSALLLSESSQWIFES